MYVHVRSLENRIPIIAANVKNKKFGGQSLIADLTHDRGIMVPKKITVKDNKTTTTTDIEVSEYKKHRKKRYSD